MTMNSSMRKLGNLPWKPLGLALLLFGVLAGCLYPGVDVGVGVNDGGYDGAYFEPGGFVYGGWGGDYRVGPGRNGERGREGGGHAYRSAAPSRRMPSLPSHGRR